MKTTLCPRFLTMLALLSLALPALPQGSLTPPGAPAPTMKRLDEVEARTIVNATNTPGNAGSAYIISAPGSYYLTGNISVTSGNGIMISADDVRLDLNGFRIFSNAAGGSGSGVVVSGGPSGIAICNGAITGTTSISGLIYSAGGFLTGISIPVAAHVQIDRLRLTRIGGDGILVNGSATVVTNCSVYIAKGSGISATNGCVENCVAEACGQHGIQGDVLENCVGNTKDDSFTFAGIYAFSSAHNCTGRADHRALFGLTADTALNCTGSNTGGTYGLFCFSDATNCIGTNSGTTTATYGLYCATATNCSGKNTSTGASTYGLLTTNAMNCTGTTSGTASTNRGISALGTLTSCRGVGGGGTAVAIEAAIAIGCTFSGGTTSITNKYNMP